MTSAVFPAGPGIRVDTHVQAGSAVPPQYDSLLAKLVVSGPSRAEALARLRGALARCEIGGVATTLGVHAALAADAEFAAGGVATDSLTGWLGRGPRPSGIKKMVKVQLTDVLAAGRQPEPVGGHRAAHRADPADRAPVLNRSDSGRLTSCRAGPWGWQYGRTGRTRGSGSGSTRPLPDAHLQFIGTGLRFISWERAHPDVLQLVDDRLVAAGITRSWCSTRHMTWTRCGRARG